MRRILSCLFALALCLVGTAVLAGQYEGKRVLHIDSYHQGNTWNDRIAEAVRETLDGTPPSRIPLAHNKEGQPYFNRRIAAKLGITTFPPLAEIVE